MPDPELERQVQVSTLTREGQLALAQTKPGGALAHDPILLTPARVRWGMATEDVMPTGPLRLDGAFGRERQKPLPVPGPLQVRALLVDDGRTRAGVVSVDAWMLPGQWVEDTLARQRIVPTDKLILAATGTTDAPSLSGRFAPVEQEWSARVQLAVIHALAQAEATLTSTPLSRQVFADLRLTSLTSGVDPFPPTSSPLVAGRSVFGAYPLTSRVLIEAQARRALPLTVDGGQIRGRLTWLNLAGVQVLALPGHATPDTAIQFASLMGPGWVINARHDVGLITPPDAWEAEGRDEQLSASPGNFAVTLAALERLLGVGMRRGGAAPENSTDASDEAAASASSEGEAAGELPVPSDAPAEHPTGMRVRPF